MAVARNSQLLLLVVSIGSFFSVSPVVSKLIDKREETTTLEGHHVVIEAIEKSREGALLNVLLVVTPAAGHMAPSLAVGEELVRRGHNVTFLTTTEHTSEKKTMEKVKVRGMTYMSAGESVIVPQVVEMANTFNKEQSSVFALVKMLLSFVPQELAIIGRFLDQYLATNNVDMVVGEEVLEPLLQCIGTQRSVKTVILSTTFQFQPHSAPRWPWPGLTAGSVSDNLTFLQRLRVTLVGAAFQFFYENILGRLVFNSIQPHCPSVTLSQALASAGVNMPQIVPSAIGFEYPRTSSPLTTYVGPVLLRNPDPIPADLQMWLDGKEEKSVVYVSMGSHVRVNKEKGEAILNGVLSTNYSLLWSLRESNREILDGVEVDSERMRLLKWAPQLAVLGHRAVGVAIVHGGANGVHESLYSEVPLIILPINGDQMANAGRVHHQGLGIHLQEVTESSILEAIKQIDEGAYRQNVQRLKKSFIDGGGRERAVELIEFYADVGYSHLVPAYAKYDWSWVQYYNIDVYLTMILVLLFVSYLTVKCCHCVCVSFLCRRLSKVKND